MALAPGRGMSASARPLARAAAAAAARGSARGRFRLRLRPRAAPACEGGAGRASGAPEAGEGPSSVRVGGSGGGAVARPGSPSTTAIKSGQAGASGALAARSAPRDEMSVAGAVALITGTTIGALLSRHGARAARRGAARRNGGGKKSALFGALSLASAAPPPAPPLPLYGRAGCVRVGPIGERGALIAPPAPSVLGVGRAAACQRPLRLSRRFVKRVLLGLPARPRGAEPWLTEDLSPPARDGACVRPLQARARWRFRRRRCPRASSRRRPCCWAPGRCCWARGCSWPR